ncbi:MAG: tRNA preQ1(34) S-adenosylmethionine ribosyltransferase-isomerase QueA [Clostridia bacterium]|nr:tRNA preQ1(34) S-adenosylmethionine ribosyltransferase-isomerase QueA [Clostridia bacterium]
MTSDLLLKKSSYFYELPQEQIAQTPVFPRDSSRFLVCKKDGTVTDRIFSDLYDLLNPGDVLVINESKVIPARLFLKDINTGSPLELLLLKQKELNLWYTMVKPGKKAKPGKKFISEDAKLEAEIISIEENGDRLVKFSFDPKKNFMELLDEIGNMPLPPYITEKLQDKNRYQTVYATTDGSAAAPTAGLHFTPELLQRLRDKGVIIAPVLLHVGIGTFRPVKEEDITKHPMHSEFFHVPEETAKIVKEAKIQNRRIISVGTTSCRTIESAFDKNGNLISNDKNTSIFIYPGYKFKVVNSLITNFHLPESTLIMLVSALLGYDNTMKAYRYAVENKYRFFSFGDAMMIE